MDMRETLIRHWRQFWLRYAGPGRIGRWACGVAAIGTGPYYLRHALARLAPRGYFDYRAQLHHSRLTTEAHVFVDEDVLVFEDRGGGPVTLGHSVHLHRGTVVQTGQGGSLRIGANSSVQAHCHFAAYVGSIRIGEEVQIAPNCAFFSYNHSMEAGRPMRKQPLRSQGGILIEDDVWVGAGATVLDGARIRRGAIIAAGAVVTGEIPAGAVAAGVPARVVRLRPGADAGHLEARKAAGHV